MLKLNGTITAVSADYKHGTDEAITLVAVEYPDEEAAADAFLNARTQIDPYLKRISASDTRMVFKDNQEQFGEMKRIGNRIELLVNLPEKP